jgi:hypothetical protein
VAGISPRVLDVLEAALEQDPDRRPPDAQTFARALVTAGATVPSAVRVWSAPLVGTVALVVFALAVLIGWLLF